MLNSHLHGHLARREAEAGGGGLQGKRDGNLALGTRFTEQALHLLIVVAIKAQAGTQALGHVLGEQAVALYPIHAEAD